MPWCAAHKAAHPAQQQQQQAGRTQAGVRPPARVRASRKLDCHASPLPPTKTQCQRQIRFGQIVSVFVFKDSSVRRWEGEMD
ncbi:hypothetical protein Pcinc_024503 [Petrolisthes cinctipes]|uniref:Uncharacterized protein n=1 Tax=Petrolisthes cinctipes TaxID=88211 RepID=A0AAE1F9S2_PETCI|nr:hypothetical protein Pcinc_024503 [Petrolisthes cinctipes]